MHHVRCSRRPGRSGAGEEGGQEDEHAARAREGLRCRLGDGGSGSGAGDAGGSGSAVQPIEDEAPKDMNGTDENPDAPKAVGVEVPVEPTAPVAKKPVGYPIEEALRPITLPANMSEVSIAPHAQLSPYFGSDALRARYGITSQVQLGLTYLYASVYDQQNVDMSLPKGYGLHSGKAFGVDLTVLLQNWLAVRVGVPFYVSPVAFSLQLAAPIKFTFGDKWAIGGLDDLLNIRLKRFAPQFYQELDNAVAASQTCDTCNQTVQSNGHLRFSGYVDYQYRKDLAFIGKGGIDSDLGTSSASGGAGTGENSGLVTFIRAGFQYSPRHYFDIGGSLGWDDLSTLGSFGPPPTSRCASDVARAGVARVRASRVAAPAPRPTCRPSSVPQIYGSRRAGRRA